MEQATSDQARQDVADYISLRADEIAGEPIEATGSNSGARTFEYDSEREPTAGMFYRLATGSVTPLRTFVSQWQGQSARHPRVMTDVIAMNLELLLVLNNLFLAIMSHPEVLPKVGDASVEKAKLYNIEEFNVDIVEAAQLAPSLYPNDPARKDYALKLSWIARNFSLEHEFCHISNGHVDWLNNKSNVAAFDEIEIASVAGLGSLDRQTLEMDADCYGASHTLLSIFRGDPSKVLANPFMNTIADALYAIHFALYATFRISIQAVQRNRYPAGQGKPSACGFAPIHRARCSCFTDRQPSGCKIACIFSGWDRDRWTSNEGRRSRLFLKGHAWDPKAAFSERFPEGLIPACTGRREHLASNWKVLRNDLEPFKRGEKIAE